MTAGRAVAYVPSSVVVHSHEYTLRDVFRRYFDSVYSLTVIFPRHDLGTSAAMGLKYLWGESACIFRGHPRWIPYYLLYTLAKTAGTVAGHFVNYMPARLLRRLSLHAYHWSRDGG
jgi:rhamnosyltransferase